MNFRSFYLILFVMILSLSSQAQRQCVDLFSVSSEKNQSTENFVQLENLFTSSGFLNDQYSLLFKKEASGSIDYAKVAKTLETSLNRYSESDRSKIKDLLLHQMQLSENYYNSEIKAQFKMLRIALTPDGGRKWIEETLSKDPLVLEVLLTARFVSGLNEDLQTDMYFKALYNYRSARKNFSVFSNPFELIKRLPPKRALMLFLKVSEDWETKVLSFAANNKIKSSQYKKLISNIQKDLETSSPFINKVPAESLIAVIEEIQNQIKKYSKDKNLTKAQAQNISIILDGSFANGLASHYKSDIDLIILDQGLRENFIDQEYSIQKALYEVMQSSGYKGPLLPIQNIVHEAPEYFTNPEQAVEFGHLGTVSFRIFADKIEIIVYNSRQNQSLKTDYKIFEFIIDE